MVRLERSPNDAGIWPFKLNSNKIKESTEQEWDPGVVEFLQTMPCHGIEHGAER